jgi:Zn-dependent protease
LVLALNAWQWSAFGARGALFGAVLSAFIFTCVVLHELGHSLVAQAFGIPVSDITLYPIGGVAQLVRRPSTPGQELLIAIAGPAVNVVIAAALGVSGAWLFGAETLLEALQQGRDHAPTGVTLWAWLAGSNAALAVFNLLPALPMDGGRVLRAVLSWVVGQQRATRAAAGIARVLSVGLFALGAATGNYLLPLIALFVFYGAGAEVRDADFQRMLDGVRCGDAVNSHLPRLSPSTALSEAMQALIFWPASAFAVEHSGRFVGAVTRGAVLGALRTEGGTGYIASLVNRSVPRVEAKESLELARQRMGTGTMVAVFDAEVFLGLITDAELAHQLTVLQAFKRSAEQHRQAKPVRR